MRIGEFVTLLHTTKDTVRHYEELHLLTPKWDGNYKDYGEKDIVDFQVIIELKALGLGLNEIQLLFKLKQSFGCGDKQFVTQVYDQLKNHIGTLLKQEKEIRNRRLQLQQEVEKIKEFL